METNRLFYAKRNLVYGTLNRIISMLLPFIIRTIMIRILGEEYLGLSSLFTSILQVFNMAELGFSSAVTFSLYKPLALRDTDKVCKLLTFYRTAYRIIGTVILCIGIIVLPFLRNFIKGTPPSDVNIYILFLIYLASTVISYWAFAYKAVLLSANQHQDILSKIDTILAVFRYVIQIAILVVWKNYYVYIIWMPVFVLLYNIFIAYATNKRYPQYICNGTLGKSEISKLIKQIKGVAIGKAAVNTRTSFDSIVLSMFCGLVDVAIYSNYYYIFTAINGFISVLATSVTAGVGNSIAVETVDKNYSDFKKINFYFSWLSGWCCICLLCLYQPFMKIWVGEWLTAPTVTMMLFCIYFYVANLGQVSAIYSYTSGIWWDLRFLQISEMITNLALNFILGYFIGINGIIVATIITVSIFSNIGCSNKMIVKCFKRSSIEYFVLTTIYTLAVIAVAYLTASVCNIVTLSGIAALAIRSLICLIIPNVCFWGICLIDKRHRDYLVELRRLIIVQ